MSSSDTPETPGPEERVAIREAIQRRMAEEQALKHAQVKQEQREKREQRYQAQQKTRLDQARALKQKRVAAFSQSQEQVRSSLQEASRFLKKALQAATESKFPRHSPEGREQLRLIRSLESSLGALRGVRITNLSPDLDLDLDDLSDVD
jgi:hypothetical protein